MLHDSILRELAYSLLRMPAPAGRPALFANPNFWHGNADLDRLSPVLFGAESINRTVYQLLASIQHLRMDHLSAYITTQ